MHMARDVWVLGNHLDRNDLGCIIPGDQCSAHSNDQFMHPDCVFIRIPS